MPTAENPYVQTFVNERLCSRILAIWAEHGAYKPTPINIHDLLSTFIEETGLSSERAPTLDDVRQYLEGKIGSRNTVKRDENPEVLTRAFALICQIKAS